MTKRALDANAEIMDAIDDVLTWYQARGLFEQYENELGKLCVDNVLYDASVRILKAQSTHPLLPERLNLPLQSTMAAARARSANRRSSAHLPCVPTSRPFFRARAGMPPDPARPI